MTAPPRAAAAPLHAFTVDLEDWYHGLEIDPAGWKGIENRLAAGTERLLDLLAAAGARATFFVLGAAAESAPGLVREIAARGHEIATHGYGHGFVSRMGPEAFRADLQRSLEVLAGLAPGPVRGFRAPYFSIVRGTEWAFEVLRECGLRYDSSVFPVRNYRYGVPRAPRRVHETHSGLVELPPSTWRLGGTNLPVAGGAYFRLYPYIVTRFGLGRVAAEGHPVVFYLHPWELDPEHPRIPLPRRIAWPHYLNLRHTEKRLRRLLSDFPFTTAAEVLAARGWPVAGSPETA